MKVHFISKLQSLLRTFAIFSILFLFLFALTRLVTPLLNQQHTRIENWVSQVMDQPVKIAKVSVRWNVLSPIIDFTDAVVWNDARTHALLKIDHMHIQMAIWDSLRKRQFVLGKLFISGAQLTLRQNQNKQWSLDGMRGLIKDEEAVDQQTALIELEEWLLSERRVIFQNVTIHTHPIKNPASSFYIGQLNLFFTPKDDRLQVDKGRLQFEGHQIRLGLKELFRQDITLNKMSGKLGWENQKGQWIVDMNQLYVSNADLNISGGIVLKNSADDASVIIDLDMDFDVIQVKNKSLYLPISVLKPDLVAWLDQAIVSGQSGQGKFVLRGDLRDFPFDKKTGAGKFLVDANVKGVTLAYEAGWPAIHNLDAHLLFSGNRMEITANTGKIFNSKIQHVKAVIPDLEADVSMLYVTGSIASDSAEGLTFIRKSPLDKTLGVELRNIALQGPLHLTLGLTVPLDGPEPLELAGTAIFTNNQLTLPALDLTASHLQGIMHFTKNTLNAKQMRAYLFEQPIQFDLKKEATADMVLADITGHLATQTLQKYPKMATWFTDYVSEGKIAYDAKLSLASRDSSKKSALRITSNLQGLAIDLPPPFAKTANENRLLQLDVAFDFKKSLSVLIKYGKHLQAALSYGLNGKQAFQFTKGELNIQTPHFAGRIESPEQSGMPWNATFDYLYLHPDEDNEDNLFSKLKPKDVPAIRLQVADFQYDEKHLGELKLRLEPTKQGLEIRTLVLTSPDFTLTANGVWENVPKGSVTRLSGHALSHNLEAALKRWDISPSISGKNANLAFNLRWPGAPFDPTFKELEGRANIQIKNGQIIDIGSTAAAQMGFGRLLTALSLETLRRRLKLDFSDLSHTGFSFDSLRGQFKLIDGSAITEDAEIKGPVAHISLDGRIGIVKEDYDLKLIIIPNLTANLPVLATLFGGPIIGAAVFTADKLLGATVGKMTARHYQMRGSWDNPEISLIATVPLSTNAN